MILIIFSDLLVLDWTVQKVNVFLYNIADIDMQQYFVLEYRLSLAGMRRYLDE